MRQLSLGWPWAGPASTPEPGPDRGRYLLPRGAPCRRSSNPEPALSEPDSRSSTVGRDTPANAAISTFGRPSARHNTIRARVATDADTFALFTSATSSAR